MSNWMHRFIQFSFIIIFVFIYLLLPFSLSFSSHATLIKKHHVSAAANIGLLENQKLTARYNQGKLELTIKGAPLLQLGLINKQKFVYKLPEELRFVLEHPKFKDEAEIKYRIPLLLGLLPINGTIEGSSLVLDSSLGTVTGEKKSVLDLSLVSSLSATLTINLDNLGISNLPPQRDGVLTFYGIAAKDALIDLEVLISEGAAVQLETDKFPDAPIVHEVTDKDTTVTGTGEPGTTVTVYTKDGSTYKGKVNKEGHFTVEIPTQEARTTFSTTLTDDFGNESEETIVIVKGVILELTVPESLPFKKTKIQFKEVLIPRQDDDWALHVKDTRGQGSRWKITAKTSAPLSTRDGEQLNPNALIYQKEGKTYFLHDGVLIYEGVTNNNPKMSINWKKDEGILLRINPSEALSEKEYSTTIHWTLENTP